MPPNFTDVSYSKSQLFTSLYFFMKTQNYEKVIETINEFKNLDIDIYHKNVDQQQSSSIIEMALDLQDDKLIETILLKHGGEWYSDKIVNGKNLIHYVCEKDLTNAFIILVNISYLITQLDTKRRTPLHYCAKFGSIEICKLLIKYKVALNEIDQFGNTALHVAFKYNQLNVFYEIGNNRRCKLDLKDRNGRTVLLLACIENNLDVVKWLLAKGADVYTFDWDYVTPLKAAYHAPFNQKLYELLCEAAKNK